MTESDRAPGGPPADTSEWDAMYSASEQVWSGDPNSTLIAEAPGPARGTALDVGCGEGADAVWLAQQGWDVTALDVSATALARAAGRADAAGVPVRWLYGGLPDSPPAGHFDLVNVQYPALEQEGGRSVAVLLGLVAPGGVLLFVHHADADSDAARRAGFDPADHVLPGDVRRRLDEGWDVEVFEERPRHVAAGAGAAHTLDLVLKARRRPLA